uniref:LIM zinc-binding domain-containing protein n=1 Tax=Panagrolaimus davidi TaxID=227884 RepID=A0A914PWK4_9BILA
MANKFGMAQDPTISSCAICGERVEHVDKLVVESETRFFINIHKACFKCSLCGDRLQMGHCAVDRALYGRYGPRWYCSLICCTRPISEKEAKLKEMGVQVRQPKKKE